MRLSALKVAIAAIAIAVGVGAPEGAYGQLFENLSAFGRRLDVGDPATRSVWRGGREGPKSVASGDIHGDGSADVAVANLDGTVTAYLGRGDGKFADPLHLSTGTQTLRGLVLADFNGDELLDIATAAPLDGVVVLLAATEGGGFAEPATLSTWPFARDLVTGDFDGDGRMDLFVAGGSTPGARQYRGAGDGTFQPGRNFSDLHVANGTRPVYALAAFRRPGETRDSVVATNAWHSLSFLLEPDENGDLAVVDSLFTGRDVYDLEIGALTAPASSGANDLVTASRDLGIITVWRGEGHSVADEPHQQFAVPGGPRDVRIVDLDGDGWNDVTVVLRCIDRVITYSNQEGMLVPTSELPVGRSPRQAAPADFNRDGLVDLAVINRISSDVNVLAGHAGQARFGSLDQVYAVDGEVTDIQVLDLNGDDHDDVIQLHRASSDLSIRYANEDGSLGPPEYFSVGTLPSAQRLMDINSDGRIDMITASLGRGEGDGSIGVRIAREDGGFGDLYSVAPPTEVGGRLFGLATADFDGDGNTDLAAGFFDCRLAFFRGVGDGTFEFTSVHFFAYESRALVVGDFDQDGDTDLAGASRTGLVVVVENTGDLLTTEELTRTDYESPTEGKFGTRDMRATDVDNDGDIDLVVASGRGVMLYLGRAGMAFELASDTLPGTDFPTSALTTADLDGDDEPDVAVACQVLSCIVVLTRNDDGDFLPALSVDVPAGRLLASGDLDGDGHADLVGTGSVLWTALSSRKSEPVDPRAPEESRPQALGPVINEVLAINNRLPLESDQGKKADWLELFNAAEEPVSLAGWRLVKVKLDNPNGDPPRVFEFPAEAVIESGGHLLVVCSRTQRSELHTGFRLPGRGGGILSLFDDKAEEVDRVFFPRQRANVSFARYEDGSSGFAFNNYPSPGAPNEDNGPVPPILKLERVQAHNSDVEAPARPPVPDRPIQFIARGEDDEGIVSVRVGVQRIDVPGNEAWMILYDDGLHDDGGMQDGIFSGTLIDGLPAGAAIRFRIEVEDLSDNVTLFPQADAPSGITGLTGFYTLAMEEMESPVEISEVVPRNDEGLEDEGGGRPDWVELRNCGDSAQSLDGLFLGTAFPESDKWFRFPAGRSLAPGEHLVVYCDGNRIEGELHAPFKLEPAGGQVVLVGTNRLGAHALLDLTEYESIPIDSAHARIGCGGEWIVTTPTPGSPNSVLAGDANTDGRRNISDAIGVLVHLFQGASLSCPGAGDVNDDRTLNVSDAVYLLTYLFGNGPAPLNTAVTCAIGN